VRKKGIYPLIWEEELQNREVIDNEDLGFSLTLGISEVEQIRNNCGILFYWRNRCVKLYHRLGILLTKSLGQGIIGIVNLTPDSFSSSSQDELIPNNTKQDFPDCVKFSEITKRLETKLDDYYFNLKKEDNLILDGTGKKTEDYWAQCSNCHKWRMLPLDQLPSRDKKWFCWQNPDKKYNACEVPEVKHQETHLTVSVSAGGILPSSSSPSSPASGEKKRNQKRKLSNTGKSDDQKKEEKKRGI